jgi:hypothetical protein
MNNIRNVFRRQRVANELVDRICIVGDEYFRLFLLHQRIPSMDPELKMRNDPERSRSARRSKGSWLICAWISETILSQLIVDVAPRPWHRVNFRTRIPQSRRHCQDFGAACAASGRE